MIALAIFGFALGALIGSIFALSYPNAKLSGKRTRVWVEDDREAAVARQAGYEPVFRRDQR